MVTLALSSLRGISNESLTETLHVDQNRLFIKLLLSVSIYQNFSRVH